MAVIKRSILIEAPTTVAFEQWLSFEKYPHFLPHVLEVRALGDDRYHWLTKSGGNERAVVIEVTERELNKTAAWRQVEPPGAYYRASFSELEGDCTWLVCEVEFDFADLREDLPTDQLVRLSARVSRDLIAFQRYVEALVSAPKENGYARGEGSRSG